MNHDDSGHDESTCNGLHEEISYSIRVYGISKGSEDFEKWFATVFSPLNKTVAEGFSVTRVKGPEAQDGVEVCQYNPFFPIEALEQLFIGWQEEQATQSSRILKSIKNDTLN